MTPAQGLDASARIGPPEALDTEIVDAGLTALLGAYPPPHIMAFDEAGLGIPVPAEVPVSPGHIIAGASTALELCVPADLPAVIEAWTRARVRRFAQVTVHLRRDPNRDVMLYLIDARSHFGVYLGIFVGAEGPFQADAQKPALFRPRACSLERDETSIVRAMDSAVTQVLGWTEAELVGIATIGITHPDDKALGIARWMEMLSRPGFEQRLILRLRHRDGQYIWFEVTNRNLLADPAHRRVLTALVDVSDKMEAVEALRASEQLLRQLTEALPLGIAQIDADQRIVYRNERLVEILGAPDARTLGEQFERIARNDQAALVDALDAVLHCGAPTELELAVNHSAGVLRCSLSIRAVKAMSGTVTSAILCVTDVTERVRLRAELERRAHFDTLTGCHNRASIIEVLETALRHSEQTEKGIAVVFVDLDRFKEINDRFGHAAGDELLRLTGERLLSSVRAGDIVGRLGGDEFLIVCPDVATPAVALDIAHRIDVSLARSAPLGAGSIAPGSSIGVAWADRAVACDAIVAIADQAMYESKRAGRGPVLALP
jgi:diguanylate cyclase (GGDEF)-like protein/PAS domain S-box-containing protein